MTTWDVRTGAGTLVKDLSGLGRALGTTPVNAAKHLLGDTDLVKAAPAELVTEAKAAARKKPGDGTPPPISTGNFVSWSGGKGKVDLLVRNGKVPGVEGDVEGTAKSPAARVVVWKNGKPTKAKYAASTHTLRRIAPLDREKKSAEDPGAALVAIQTEHDEYVNQLDLPDHARVTGTQIKAVFDRGTEAWPGYERTSMDRAAWGLGRVEHFVKVAAGEIEAKDAGHDRDLLPEGHPLALVRISRDELDPTVRSLLG